MFDHVEHKLSYLSERFAKHTLKEWYVGLRTALSEAGDRDIADGVFRALAIDACYCMARHQPWANTQLFSDLLSEVLITDYALSPRSAKAAHQYLCQALGIPPTNTHQDEQETAEAFLKFIFVQSVCAANDDELMRDLGFGDQLLKRLRKTARSTIDQRNGAPLCEQTAPAEQIFSKIMVRMAKQVRRLPWIVDVYRLQYLLFGPGIQERFGNGFQLSKALFRILLKVGRKRHISEQRLSQLIKEKIDLTTTGWNSPEALLAYLENLQLIYPQAASSGSERNWTLAKDGLQMTADAFAVIVNRKQIDNAKILQLHPIYQTAVIRHLPEHATEQARELVLYDAEKLSPPALEQCVAKIVKSSDQTALAEQVMLLIPRMQSAWSKAALYRSLAALPRIGSVGQRLAAMAESEDSPRAQQAALQAAARHNKAQPSTCEVGKLDEIRSPDFAEATAQTGP